MTSRGLSDRSAVRVCGREFAVVAGGDTSTEIQVADWYWGIFSETYLPQILKADDEAEFEERFDAMMEVFMAETNYAQAKANMEAYFEQFPPIWDD
jgi:hypothetical protein